LTRTRPVRRLLPLVVAVGVIASTVGCSADDGGSSASSSTVGRSKVDDSAVLAGVVDELVVPNYRTLEGSLTAWSFELGEMCREPGAERLAEARKGWAEAVELYEKTVSHDVGPAMDLRFMSDIAFAPRAASIDKLIAGTDPVDKDAMAERGANVRGLYSAEHALFGEASQELTGPEGARRCQYLASIGDLALDAATAVTEAWRSGGGRQEFLAADGSDPEDALPQLLNSVTHAVKAVDEKGLRDMAAAETYQDLPDTRIDGPGAFGIGRRKARLDGAVAVIGEGDGGLVAIVASRSPETAQRLETAAEAAAEAVDRLPDAVADTFATPEAAADLDAAAKAVAALKVVLATEVAGQLGVTITLSDSDGDS